MAKRRADKELNHDNWDQEDDSPEEDMGEFKKASEDELSKRKIKVAKRRSGAVPQSDSGPNLFKNFTGFSNIGSAFGSSSTLPTFDFSSGKPSLDSKPFEATSFKFTPSIPATSFSASSDKTAAADKAVVTSNGKKEDSPTKKSQGEAESEANKKAYLANLKILNEGVLKWIQKHLDSNIYINLTPVFDDYRKHFEGLQKKYKPKFTKLDSTLTMENKAHLNNGKTSPEKKTPKTDNTVILGSTASTNKVSDNTMPTKPACENKSSLFSFSSDSNAFKGTPNFTFGGTTDEKKESSGFTFGTSDSKTPSLSFGAPNFSSKDTGSGFGLSSAEGKAAAFSFGAASNFTFATSAPTPAKEDSQEDGDTKDEPPKVEIVEVKEDDAIYEQKCKLFYKKENSYVEKGVGTLFLKPIKDDNKTQLVIRAATNLGNLLLNIVLNSSLPTQRTGKNNVLLVCVPNPPIDPDEKADKPYTMLIRVKTAEDADKLLKIIDERKEM